MRNRKFSGQRAGSGECCDCGRGRPNKILMY
jgi:hypothetical protein